jgi:predicted MFS family arabinose efflux permease
MRLYTSSAFRAVTWLGLLTYLGAFLSDEIGLSIREIGLVFTVTGGGFAVGGVMAGRLMARFTPRWVVVLACIVGASTTSCALLSGSVGVVLPLLFITSVASSISAIGIVIGLSAESPAYPGVTMVFNGTTLNLGTAAGSALGGILIASGGYHALALGLPLFALIAAVSAWWPSTRGS